MRRVRLGINVPVWRSVSIALSWGRHVPRSRTRGWGSWEIAIRTVASATVTAAPFDEVERRGRSTLSSRTLQIATAGVLLMMCFCGVSCSHLGRGRMTMAPPAIVMFPAAVATPDATAAPAGTAAACEAAFEVEG